MGHHLDGLPQIVSMPLAIDDGLVDATRRNRVVAGRMYARESFIVPQIEIRLHTVYSHVALAVLIRVQRTRINVYIRIKLLDGYLVTACLQQLTDTGRNDSLSQGGNHTARNEDVLCIHKTNLFYGLQSYDDFTKKQFSPGLFQLLKTARTIILLRLPTPYPIDSLHFEAK